MAIKTSRLIRRIAVVSLACCMVMAMTGAVFADEGTDGSLAAEGVDEINKAYDYTVQTGGDNVGASAGISSGGWSSLGSKLSYMKFPEGVAGPEGEEGVWCYCIDISTDTENGHKYSITTLDAANYYDDAAADKIRSILLNSYPNMEISKLEETYGLTELMEEEAFMATQWILWYYSNPEGLVDAGGGNYYPADIYKPSEYPRETITMWYDDDEGNEVRKSSSNIVKLAKALDALAPAAAYETEPAEVSFKKKVYEDKAVFDYSQTKGLESLANISITVKDEKGREVPFAVSGNRVIVEYEDLEMADGAIELTIRMEAAQRLARDVYFFAPEGGRDASQSRVAAYEGTAPVANSAVFTLTTGEFEEGEEFPEEDPEDPQDPTVPEDPADGDDPAGGLGDGEMGTPETGDDFDLMPFVLVAITALATAMTLYRKRKKI